MSRFTDMELAIAKSVDLVAVASHMGYGIFMAMFMIMVAMGKEQT